MLILRTLLFGPAHGHQIAKHIQRTTDDLLQVEHGSLYPALHRLERKGWLASKWEPAGKDLKREYKYYRLTAAGKKQLVAQESKWKTVIGAMARIMWPTEENCHAPATLEDRIFAQARTGFSTRDRNAFGRQGRRTGG